MRNCKESNCEQGSASKVGVSQSTLEGSLPSAPCFSLVTMIFSCFGSSVERCRGCWRSDNPQQISDSAAPGLHASWSGEPGARHGAPVAPGHGDAKGLGASLKSGFSAKKDENPVQSVQLVEEQAKRGLMTARNTTQRTVPCGRGCPVAHAEASLAPPPQLQAEQLKQEGSEKRG